LSSEFPSNADCGTQLFNPFRVIKQTTLTAYRSGKGAQQPLQDRQYGPRQCVVCGEQFAPTGPTQKSCSDKCKRIRRYQNSQPTVADIDGLSIAENAVYERLIDGLPPNALALARARSAQEKRVEVTLGMLNPMLVPPEGLDPRQS
jgi:hypothetical protein